MIILVLIITHIIAFSGGLFLNRYINANSVSNTVKKLVSKKAEIIENFNIDEIEI